MSEFIKSKKYTGVSYKLLKNKDKSYYISYKMNDKFKRLHIGKKVRVSQKPIAIKKEMMLSIN